MLTWLQPRCEPAERRALASLARSREFPSSPACLTPQAREEETAVAGPRETGCSEEERFRLEMEFVQCLANPDYLHCEAVLGGLNPICTCLSIQTIARPVPPQSWRGVAS